MAYSDLENFETHERQIDPALLRTTFMAGTVGVAVWELLTRHFAIFFIEQDVTLAPLLQTALHLDSRLTAEIFYFMASIIVLPALYLTLWRPLITYVFQTKHWFVTGGTFGALLTLGSIFALHPQPLAVKMLADPNTAFWLLHSAMWTGLAVAGFVRLRELGRQII